MESEMVFTHADMVRHRTQAVADTMDKVRKDFELEIQGLEDIAESCKDESIKTKLERRISRIRLMLSKTYNGGKYNESND